MVVEDDANDQVLIERAFRKIGVTDPIQIVGSGSEAIAYMMGEGKYSDRQKYAYPTFIMTDLKMPKADGFAVANSECPAGRRVLVSIVPATRSLWTLTGDARSRFAVAEGKELSHDCARRVS